MNGRVVGAEPFRCLEFSDSVILTSLAFVDNAQVEMCDGNRRLDPHCVLKVWHCFAGSMESYLRIAEIG